MAAEINSTIPKPAPVKCKVSERGLKIAIIKRTILECVPIEAQRHIAVHAIFDRWYPEFSSCRGKERKRYLRRRCQAGHVELSPPLENQRGIRATKSKRVRERILHGRLARRIRHVVQIALRIGSLVVNRRRQNLVAEREH